MLLKRMSAFILVLAALTAPVWLRGQTTSIGIPASDFAPPVMVIPASAVNGAGTVSSPFLLFPDGTSGAPSIAFTAEPTTGFWRSSAAIVTLQGGLTVTGSMLASGDVRAGAANSMFFTGRAVLQSPANGVVTVENNAATIGSNFKTDALPTVASGFFSGGVSPAITAGSTPLAGSVNVGTVTASASGIINFNGTAFPSAPFCTCMNSTTAALLRCTSSTTQLTITGLANFVASDVLVWQCISSK